MFKPAQTLAEAESFAVSNGIANKATYKGLSLDTANELNKVAKQYSDEYGFKFETIGEFNAISKEIKKKVKKRDTTLAAHILDKDKSYLTVNKKMLGDSTVIAESVAKLKKQGLIHNPTLNGILTHEMGHAVDNMHDVSKFDTISLGSISRFNSKHKDAYTLGMSQAEKKLRTDIGSYMFTNDDEFFAESFRLYNAKALPKELEYMSEIFEKLKVK